LENAHEKKVFGSNRADKPNALLGLASRMNQNIVEVQNLGSPGIQKREARLLPSGVEAEGAQAFFEFRGSKEGSRGFAITINHARVDSSGITRSRADADENKTVRSSDGICSRTPKAYRCCSARRAISAGVVAI
jgi:hypothetical protein